MLERKKQKVTVPTIETKQITVPTVAGLKSALSGSVASAQSRGGATLEGAKAVSYTHLDVYKRQEVGRGDEAPRELVGDLRERLLVAHPVGLQAVYYTHLDVYKRQARPRAPGPPRG